MHKPSIMALAICLSVVRSCPKRLPAHWISVLGIAFTIYSAQAISIGPSGSGVLSLSTLPNAADWATMAISGGATTYMNPTALDAGVQGLSASSIVNTLATSSSIPPTTDTSGFRWNSNGQFLQSRPTGNAATVLKATLQNDTMGTALSLNISYDFAIQSPGTFELPGLYVYYSLSGTPNSWIPIPELSGSEATATVSATLDLSATPWAPATPLYLLWIDDNGDGGSDPSYTIDNVVFSASTSNMPLSITLTAPANGQHFGSGSAISARVALTGSPTNVSYYLDGSLAAVRTTAPFTPVSLPAQPLGAHTLYATALDTNNTLLTTVTNTFVIDTSLSGTLGGDTTLFASNSPCLIDGTVTVPDGITLRIEAGTTVHMSSGVSLNVAARGRILAEGTEEAPIRITPASAGGSWGNINISGGTDTNETRFVHTYFEGNSSTCFHVADGNLYLDHCSFGTRSQPVISIDRSSFVVSDCYFPPTTSALEPFHGTGGLKAGGRGIIRNCFFGAVMGYSDTIDFTGANRPSPILQVYNNVFMGSGDDNLDLDSTDAWVEGNIFMHVHKNGSPDTASPISGGDDIGNNGDVTIVGNIFYDIDQAVLTKQGNFYTLINNTIVRQTHIGGLDTTGAVLCTQDNNMAEALGMYLEANIMVGISNLTRDVETAVITFTNNLMPLPWAGPGDGNRTNDPMLTYIPQLSETMFTNWASAQIMKQWFTPRTGSPALASGPNGRNIGAAIPMGISISDEPSSPTAETSATLRLGFNLRGHSIPTDDFPNGSGYTHYRWRLDTNAWSAELPIATPLIVSNLSDGPHYVEVIGKNDANFYQNDPDLGANAVVSVSRTWIVQTGIPITSWAREGNTYVLHFPGSAGSSYSVQYKDDLRDPTWTKLDDFFPQNSGDVPVVDTNLGDRNRFYRIVSPAQP